MHAATGPAIVLPHSHSDASAVQQGQRSGLQQEPKASPRVVHLGASTAAAMALQEHDEHLEGVEDYEESDGDYVEEEELAGDEELLDAAGDAEVYTDDDVEEIEGDEGALGGHRRPCCRCPQSAALLGRCSIAHCGPHNLRRTFTCRAADDEEDQPGGGAAGGGGPGGQGQMLYIPGLGYIPLATFPGRGGAGGARGPAAPPPQPEGEREWSTLQVGTAGALYSQLEAVCRSPCMLPALADVPAPLHALSTCRRCRQRRRMACSMR